LVTFAVSAVLATLFTAWTPTTLDFSGFMESFRSVERGSGGAEVETTEAEGASGAGDKLRIGIVAGHSGPHPETGLEDPGATCPDGLTEVEVNQDIASLVVKGLEAVGFQSDLLEEFDPRLPGYKAVALVSIHADSCDLINDQATGYKVSAAVESAVPDRSQRLVNCLVDRYGRATGLTYHPGSITRDMTDYHTFFEIHNQTPAVIIETGFLYHDRGLLTGHPERAAQGIVDGILCYVNLEPTDLTGEASP
jgi:N-acetylmuramoyl-L-alanine amidase